MPLFPVKPRNARAGAVKLQGREEEDVLARPLVAFDHAFDVRVHCLYNRKQYTRRWYVADEEALPMGHGT